MNNSEYLLSAENELDITEEPDQSSEQQSDLQDEESEESVKYTQSVTPYLNTKTPQRTEAEIEPTNETKTLKPQKNIEYDFLGDRYFVDEFPSQTVSLCVFGVVYGLTQPFICLKMFGIT